MVAHSDWVAQMDWVALKEVLANAAWVELVAHNDCVALNELVAHSDWLAHCVWVEWLAHSDWVAQMDWVALKAVWPDAPFTTSVAQLAVPYKEAVRFGALTEPVAVIQNTEDVYTARLTSTSRWSVMLEALTQKNEAVVAPAPTKSDRDAVKAVA